MSLLEGVKSKVERWTGIARPDKSDLAALVRARKANAYFFADDGETPNHPHYPLIHYRSPVLLTERYDPAAIFEALFESHGWASSWRNGIYDFLHFHTETHEVLGIVRGEAEVQFGGAKGRVLHLKAGDVAVLPAGTGHMRKSASKDLLVVGAYPKRGQYDEPRPDEIDIAEARASIRKVTKPKQGPVYGRNGTLTALWVRA